MSPGLIGRPRRRGRPTPSHPRATANISPTPPDARRGATDTLAVGDQGRQLREGEQTLDLTQLLDLRLACGDDRRVREASCRGGAGVGVSSGIADPVALLEPALEVPLRRLVRRHPAGAKPARPNMRRNAPP